MSIFVTDPIVPANGGAAMRQTKRRHVSKSASGGFITHPLPVKKPTEVHKTVSVPDGKVVSSLNFMGDFYFRIWVIPSHVTALNPQVGSVIKSTIWNAYPYPNTLRAALQKDADAIESTLVAPYSFKELETFDVDYTIISAESKRIRAMYQYNFDEGDGEFTLEATISSDLISFPETPLKEIWQWQTNVLRKVHGGEQRIALRQVPRRRVTGRFSLFEKGEIIYWKKNIFRNMKNVFNIPLPQYRSFIQKDADIGETEIVFNPIFTDLREGETAYIANEDSVSGIMVEIKAMKDTGAVLSDALTTKITKGMGINPVVSTNIEDGSSFQVSAMYDVLSANFIIRPPRKDFKRPGSKPVIIRCDEIIVLDKRPLAKRKINQSLTTYVNKIDNKINEPLREVFVDRSFRNYTYDFLINRARSPEEMDWWRNVLYEVRGRQKRLLVPSWRNDFETAEPPQKNSNVLILKGTDYHEYYYPSPGAQYLWIKTGTGFLARRVLTSTVTGGGDNSLELSDLFGQTDEDLMIEEVSILYVNRLSSDSVSFVHEDMYSFVTLQLQTIDR